MIKFKKMRTVIVYDAANSGRTVITTSATTWGSLKTEILAQGIDLSSKKVLVRESEAEIAGDNYVLPTGDFMIILSPAGKVKSGK